MSEACWPLVKIMYYSHTCRGDLGYTVQPLNFFQLGTIEGKDHVSGDGDTYAYCVLDL